MPVVKVVNGAIIGTKVLVTKDVGHYEIWGSNPAQLIRKRFSDEVVADLQHIRWWNLDMIEEYLDAILSTDIERLKIISASI